MKSKIFAAMLAAGLSAALVPVATHSAAAGEVLNRLRSHGLGKWVDKYVEEDKSGKTHYKQAKEDTWSQEYYDSKTGNWTGKRYNDEPSTAEVKKTPKKGNVALSSKKSQTSVRTAGTSYKSYKKKYVKTETSEVTGTGSVQAADPVKSDPPVIENKTENKSPETPLMPAAKTSVQGALTPPATVVAAAPELYGPPAPDDFGPSIN